MGTTSLRFKVQKQTQDQERAEIHLEGKDARSDNEAARRTEDARQGLHRDTTPDLTLCKNAGRITWENTFEDLGSNHRMFSIALGNLPSRNCKRTIRRVEWDQFRKSTKEKEQGPIGNVEECSSALLRDVEKATTKMECDDWLARREGEDECGGTLSMRMDSRLAHLVEAKKSIQQRLHRQKHNRNLRRKLAELNKHIETHCTHLCHQEWGEECDAMNSNINTGKTWKILKYLLDPSATKTAVKAEITKIRHRNKGNIHQMGDEIFKLYLGRPPAVEHQEYSGSPNEYLDRDLSQQEIRAALQTIKTKSAPGPEKVSNKMLRNLDEQGTSRLTNFVNECWRNGEIPDEWKITEVILITKPGKPLEIQNMRPISLTSCVGKVMEHACLNRVNGYLESNNVLSNIIGFRRGLSTQDAMIQLKQQVMDPIGRGMRAIIRLDLRRAFDMVEHAAILKKLHNSV
nr:uncharacterized protein LOC119172996 [Rhipicephalus microplus]